MALLLFLMVVPAFTFLLQPLASLYSRRHEYEADAQGTLVSPEIDLTGVTEPVQLLFRHFLSAEAGYDFADVGVLVDGRETVLASNNPTIGGLPSATNGFEEVALDLSAFRGQRLRVDPLALFERVARKLVAGLQPQRSNPSPQPPLLAFEHYIKGLLAEKPETQLKFLQTAVQLHPGYDRAYMAMWEVHTAVGDHQKALATLRAAPLPFRERLRWMRDALSRRLEGLPPFWLAFALTLTETVGVGVLALPIAFAGFGQAGAIALLTGFGLLNVITVAALVESSDVKGHKLLSALTRLFSRLVRIPSYTVRVRARESAAPEPDEDTAPPAGDRLVSVTVDVHENITGRSEHQITLPPLRLDSAATRAAGFVASRIFLNDRSTREWAKARFDGEDLSAYLSVKSPFTCGGGWCEGDHDYTHEYDPHRGERRRCIELLERVASSRRVAGVVRYELASLYELEGEHVKALRLHALNRAQFRTDPFERSRYRMVVLLKMIANYEFADTWTREHKADLRDIYLALDEAGIYPTEDTFPTAPPKASENTPTEQEFVADDTAKPSGDSLLRVRLVLLHIAGEEARRIKENQSLPRVACEVVFKKKRTRHRTLSTESHHDEKLMDRYRIRKRSIEVLEESIEERVELAVGHVPKHQEPESGEPEEFRKPKKSKEPREKPPLRGNELYNKACLHAVREVEPFCERRAVTTGDKEAASAGAVGVMRQALHPSLCEHYHPSELLLVDPDLRCLRGIPAFDRLVEEQLRRDWGPSRPLARSVPGDRLLDAWVIQRIHHAWSGADARTGSGL